MEKILKRCSFNWDSEKKQITISTISEGVDAQGNPEGCQTSVVLSKSSMFSLFRFLIRVSQFGIKRKKKIKIEKEV